MDKIKITKDESINCVKSSTWKLMCVDYRKWTIFIAFIHFLILILFVFYLYNDTKTDGLFNILIFFLIIPSIYYGIIKSRVQKKFMMEFANTNNFTYQNKGFSKNSVKGGLFKFGTFLKIINIVTGDYKDHRIHLFNYIAQTGSGKNRKMHHFTVFEIIFKETNFPYILLSSKKMRVYYNERKALKIPLEDEFSKDFSLFCREGYEIEALQIFTPELLSFLRDKGLKFSIEFIEDRLYIFEKGFIGKRDHLYELYKILQMILDSYGPLLQRIQKDFKALHKYYK